MKKMKVISLIILKFVIKEYYKKTYDCVCNKSGCIHKINKCLEYGKKCRCYGLNNHVEFKHRNRVKR